MQIALIAALGRDMTIGVDGEMPWPRPGDLMRFKQLTLGKPVLLGRRTWESIGSPLPERTNIVLSRDDDYEADGCWVAHSLEEAAELAGETLGVDQLMVAGGSDVYEQCLPWADRMYLTVVYHDFEGDSFFPNFHPADWLIEQRRDHDPDEQFDWSYASFVLRRNRDKPLRVEGVETPSKLPDLLRDFDAEEVLPDDFDPDDFDLEEADVEMVPIGSNGEDAD
jgi:dihydrofolate reductase